jgi:molecular chaperone DnaK (HSP70)
MTSPRVIRPVIRPVTSKNYGFGFLDGEGQFKVQNLIFANSPVDGNCRGERTFFIPKTGAAYLNFPIYESDNGTTEPYDIEMATLLDREHSLQLPINTRRGDQFTVIFEIDTNGLLHVNGVVLDQSIHFNLKFRGRLQDDLVSARSGLNGLNVMDEQESEAKKANIQPHIFIPQVHLNNIDKLGDPLTKINEATNWAMFRPALEKAWNRGQPPNVTRKEYDVIVLFKILILQSLHNLSDDATEFEILDRYSFGRFWGLHIGEKIPDAVTIRRFRQDLNNAGITQALFAAFDAHRHANDAMAALNETMVDVSRASVSAKMVFGIDLGTTYSCVAQVDEHGEAVVLWNFECELTTPSVVYFGSNDEVYVGKAAKEYSTIEPEKTVAFIKREMGKNEAFKTPTKFPLGLTPTEISARILKKIVWDANAAGQYPEPIKKVVITCPAYFGHAERERTRQAGEIAGLEVLAILNEPTAAAIAYGQGKQEGEKIVLVYDLGGGTFDVAIVKVNDGESFACIATDGNNGLGGYDWDKRLAQYLLSEYNKQKSTSYEMKEGTALFNEMMIFAEAQKKRLTAKKDENSKLSAILTIKGDTAKIDITRAVFDAMTAGLLNETIEKTHNVLRVGKEKGFNRLDEVLLVGGSCFMPQVKARLDSELGCNAKLYDPNLCVAKGAAIFGNHLEELHNVIY